MMMPYLCCRFKFPFNNKAFCHHQKYVYHKQELFSFYRQTTTLSCSRGTLARLDDYHTHTHMCEYYQQKLCKSFRWPMPRPSYYNTIWQTYTNAHEWNTQQNIYERECRETQSPILYMKINILHAACHRLCVCVPLKSSLKKAMFHHFCSQLLFSKIC